MTTTQKPLVRNAADAEQVRRGRESQSDIRMRELNDLRFLMSHIQGRRFIWRLLGQTHIDDLLFVQSSEIYARAARHDLGVWIKRELDQADPAGYVTMIREAAHLRDTQVEPESSEESE